MEYISRTQKKKEALSLQKLGEKLVKMPDRLIDEMDLPQEIYEAVKFARTIKSNSARRRHMQYIGTLMRRVDPGPIQQAVDNIEQGSYKKAVDFRETEMWREELIKGNSELMEEIVCKYPGADRRQLSQLVRNAEKEKEINKSRKASRALFRYLKEIKARRIETQTRRDKE